MGEIIDTFRVNVFVHLHNVSLTIARDHDLNEPVRSRVPFPCMLLHFPLIKKLVYLLFIAYCFVWVRWMPWADIFSPSEGSGIQRLQFADLIIRFDYKTLPRKGVCDRNPALVAVVLSTPDRQAHRMAIRNSWAARNYSKQVKEDNVAVVFMLSAPRDRNQRRQIAQEANEFEDLIVTSLSETYENLLYKVYAIMQWQQNYCPGAKYLLKVDDDVIIHFDRLLTVLPVVEPPYPQIYCKTWAKAKPKNDTKSKWFLGAKWKREYFPIYCDGPAYVLTAHATASIIDATRFFTPIHIEDVFFTGMVAERLRIRRNGLNHVFHHDTKEFKKGEVACSASGELLLAAVHSVNKPEKIQTAATRMNNLRCRNPKNARKSKFSNAHAAVAGALEPQPPPSKRLESGKHDVNSILQPNKKSKFIPHQNRSVKKKKTAIVISKQNNRMNKENTKKRNLKSLPKAKETGHNQVVPN